MDNGQYLVSSGQYRSSPRQYFIINFQKPKNLPIMGGFQLI